MRLAPKLYVAVAWTLLLALAVLHISVHVAAADDGHHGHQHINLHSGFYSQLHDKNGQSCCNDTDCRPSSFRSVNGKAEIMVDGEWVDLPEDKVLRTVAPDKGTHVCAPKQPNLYHPKGTVFCVVIGTGS